MFEGGEFSLTGTDFRPRLFEPPDRGHVEASNDGHQGVEVSKVDAVTGYFDPKFDGLKNKGTKVSVRKL